MIKKRKVEKKGKKKEVKRKKISTKKVIWAIIIIFLILFVLFLFLFKDQITIEKDKILGNIFEWHGMKWYKKMHGNLTTYSTQLAIHKPLENKTFFYTLSLRNDPRKLEEIPANITEKPQRMVYVSFEPEPLKCKYTVLAAWRIGEFLDALGLKKEGALAYNFSEPGLNLSNNTSHKIKNCSDAKEGISVILLKEGPENKVYQEGYCYILESKNCETLETSERFVLALIELLSP